MKEMTLNPRQKPKRPPRDEKNVNVNVNVNARVRSVPIGSDNNVECPLCSMSTMLKLQMLNVPEPSGGGLTL